MRVLLVLSLLATPGLAQQDRYGTPTASAPVSVPAATTPDSGTSFEVRIAALEIALSETIANDPGSWRLDRLRREASDLLSSATNDRQRAQARSAADRIQSFESLARRWKQPRATPARSFVDRDTNRTKLAPTVQLTKASSRSSQHDAEGVLRPVVSKRPDAPKYAVVNEQGKIAALVTPTPETEQRLKQLVGRRVGLGGQRGFRTDLKREHVVAERVTPLGTVRR